MFTFFSTTSSKRYHENDQIPVYANKVSPYHNPFETYDFYSLPFCQNTKLDKSAPNSLADAFLGNKLQRTPILIEFKRDVLEQSLCEVKVDKSVYKKFHKAVENGYYYQLYMDKLPMWGYVGTQSSENTTLIWTRQHFRIGYNADRVIEVNMSTEVPNLLEEGKDLKFTYSVQWVPTNKNKSDRYVRYAKPEFFQSSVTYWSLIYVVLFILVLIFIAALQLRNALGNDFLRFQRESQLTDFEIDFKAERGWKMLHADVFRSPRRYSILSLLIGVGSQVLFALVLFFIINITIGSSFGRSTRLSVGFCCYAIAAFVGGYFGGGLYKRWGGRRWILHLTLLTFTIPIACVLAEIVLNIVAFAYHSTQIVKLTSILSICFMIVVIVLPVTIFGGIIGRYWFIVGDNPARVSCISRRMPPLPYYLETPIIGLFVGFIGAISIFEPVRYILGAVAQHQMYHVWGFLLVAMVLLLAVISILSILITYARLNKENYLWQWSSFSIPLLIGAFVFGYSIFYFFFHTKMSGFLQAMYYFAYGGIVSCIIGIICGFIGFSASALFIRAIYKNVKTD